MDFTIIGAGFTGLSAAYDLARAEPPEATASLLLAGAEIEREARQLQ